MAIDLYELHSKFEKYMHENGVSPTQINKFYNEFNRLSKYMTENSYTYYNEEIGLSYLSYREFNISDKTKRGNRSDKRYIVLLNGMLKGVWIYQHRENGGRNYDLTFPGTLGDFFTNFLNDYCNNRRLADSTRRIYYRCLYSFCERLELDNIYSVNNITSELILSFSSGQVSNCNNCIIILRAVLRKLFEQGAINFYTSNILEQTRTQKLKKLPSYFSPSEISILESNIDRMTACGKRDYAMILLSTRLGLRSSDIRYLKFSDINWNENIICIEQFKTKKIVELPLIIDIGEAIIDYIKNGRPKSDSPFIFLRAWGPYTCITQGAFHAAVRKYLKSPHIDLRDRKKGSHSLRHSLATNLLEKGNSLLTISNTLGHSSIDSTMDYIHLSVESLLLCSLDVPIVDNEFYEQKKDFYYE
ncbi:site-specific integrase [Chryseobacterium sp. MEBOG07]|uniref:site-specific integrase n=1 Tax=Chryseobacterium sp. MEBOG07 TaxID=2879939 RepID=UPI001EFFFC99|nr:site-specific integrase [Chryseobacterium sp. MEBOG07]UKB78347.1 tyrosine-type recombinase/integrase [Chryseobacterium sp. MEBOG07]